MCATVGLVDGRNLLQIARSDDVDRRMGTVAAEAIAICLDKAGLRPADILATVAAPAGADFRAELSDRVGLSGEDVLVAEDERMHTAALAAAIARMPVDLPVGSPTLLVAAGAGICAGAAVYRVPPPQV